MFRLNRKTEYALLAIRYLSGLAEGTRASTRTVANHYGIPEVLLGKVLQQLKQGGLAIAHKGASGGYVLARSPEHISFTEVLVLFKESTALVDCLDKTEGEVCCPQGTACDIQTPLDALNGALLAQLDGLSLATFFAGHARTATSALSMTRLH